MLGEGVYRNNTDIKVILIQEVQLIKTCSYHKFYFNLLKEY